MQLPQLHSALFGVAVVVLPGPLLAQTLPDAIAAAYANNPEIAAARAQLRQVDETVPIAAAGMRPQAGVSGSFNQNLNDNFGDLGQTWRAGVSLNQAIWEGGRIRANISEAEARVEAQRARLLATEYRVVVDTVTAYADVLRTAEFVRLNENQVRVLDQQLRASRDRFEVGDLTRTDVAQSEARLSQSRATLARARALQVNAEQAYARLVGRPPGRLAPLPPPPPIPATEAEARSQAEATNPLLAASRLDEQAARAGVTAAKRERLPSVGMQASGAYTRATGPFFGISGFNPAIGVTATVPLLSGGLIASRVRQAQAVQSQALELASLSERQVAEAASATFNEVRAAEAVIAASRVQVEANALAAEGVRQENEVGSRDILDVLNAEQELLNARVNLVQAERDRYVAAYSLLELIGRLEQALEGAPVARYDPTGNAARVRGKGFSEFSYDPDPRTDRTRNTAPLMGPLAEPPQ